MINKLKRKFLLISTLSTFALMTVLVLIMNIVNYRGITSDVDSILDTLSNPRLPHLSESDLQDRAKDFSGFVPPGMSPEVLFESRFFAVLISPDGELLQSDLSRIVSVDSDSAKAYIEAAQKSGSGRGFIGSFRYAKATDEKGTRILFLDCGRKLDSFKSFLWISIVVGLLGCLAVFLALFFAAGRIVAPIAESYEKQKRFISDAGHEIKTPLTIINANVDLLELEGENEELADIRMQTKRLTDLTNHLVMLSKMEEAEHTLPKIAFPLSELANETVGSFRAPAAARSLAFEVRIDPGITMTGSPDTIRQLISILLDNAIKYTPDNGRIRVCLSEHKKSALLTVENTVAEKISEEDLPRVFDRFYRTDRSRNSATGGHGIGLSIAKAITEAHGGTIAASTDTGYDFRVTASLPT